MSSSRQREASHQHNNLLAGDKGKESKKTTGDLSGSKLSFIPGITYLDTVRRHQHIHYLQTNTYLVVGNPLVAALLGGVSRVDHLLVWPTRT